MYHRLLTIFFFLNFLQIHAQNKGSNRYFSIELEVHDNEVYSLNELDDFTSFSLEYKGLSSPNAWIVVDSDSIELTKDPHFISDDNTFHSVLTSFPEIANTIKLFTGRLSGQVVLHFINGSLSGDLNLNHKTKSDSACSKPESIPQSVWRSGLTPPQYQRIETETKHIIIHHSAGSNTNTNYTQVVRDIYIYHTQVNGWSDIGYNYLIAQDGTIYDGRDPDNYGQDEVQGAHFCGLNANTMGICLLGNYSQTTIKKESIESLMNLLQWKLFKDVLDPTDYMDKGSLSDLGVIAGHRDGCSTECPGNNLYAAIDSLRNDADKRLDFCENGEGLFAEFYGTPIQIIEGGSVVFTNTSNGYYDEANWYFEGGIPQSYFGLNPPPIVYNNEGVYSVRLTIGNGQSESTYVKEDYVEVKKLRKPTIAPNPINAPYELRVLNVTEGSKIVRIYNASGQQIIEERRFDNPLTIDCSSWEKGFYIINIHTAVDTYNLSFVIY